VSTSWRVEELLQSLRRLTSGTDNFEDFLIRRIPPGSRFREVLYRSIDWRDRRRARLTAFAAPPAGLRFRVHGDLDLESFLETGKQCAGDIRRALEHVDRDIGSFEIVLDFGCGCGRTLRWLAPWAEKSELHGTDIDRDAISWCQRSIPFARFAVNDALPPLPYPDESFDLVYLVSVFTHLTEDLQFRWLEELRRVARRGGYVLVTVRGSYYVERLAADDRAELEKRGFVFSQLPDHLQDMFPGWYQTATHTEDYVRKSYSAYFEVVRHLPQALDGCQDIVILKRPAA
jgi:SAM-dependent methyltransferase